MKKIVTFLFLIWSSLAFAHDLWIEKEDKNFVLYYGHRGIDFLKYNPENIIKIYCFDKNLNNVDFKISNPYPVKINGKCEGIYLLYSSGYWTKTPYGEKNLPKDKVDTPIESWLSYESVKRIESFIIPKPISDNLEIVALNDITKLKEGDKIRLQVFFNKRPISNIVVAYEDKPMGMTDEEGKINIRIKHSGFQNIVATYVEKINSSKADKIIYTTHLNFEVK
ncbi:hypothetical protein JCM14244_13210 [Venenivibrio stagnispumantis]|uniref:Nickel transport protein n=1 Tax=Venenivibrio stagnispumantis TaxID=407998 RepID=A0AA46AE12_9AQUI|nr:DUF4198 domain-containing protein [Venenivibrio stagnispumantis]MCW4573100.1 DUF4198 domain-containing protein [Venenivibrio stagnispumantis]SMP09103.1 nickel transport protein [Venenivibrio stagnispumantis]